ncbi:MAG: S16 family serine protease [Candidatus Methanomethylicia archaeon]
MGVNRILSITLIISLTINLALTSIIIALNIRSNQLESIIEELSIEVSKSNSIMGELQAQLNYTKQQLEYYRMQLEYYTKLYQNKTGIPLIGKSEVNIVAVRVIQEDFFTTSYEGVVMKAEVELTPGDGKILVNTKPNIGIDLQASVRIAAAVAEKYTGVSLGSTNVIISVIANEEVEVVDGPSAGAAITIAIISAITKQSVNNTIYITGTINSDGSIGQVGGIIEKAIASARNGCKIFLVPKGQAQTQILIPVEKEIGRGIKIITYQYKTINVEQYLKSIGYHLKIIEVSNIIEALNYTLIKGTW